MLILLLVLSCVQVFCDKQYIIQYDPAHPDRVDLVKMDNDVPFHVGYANLSPRKYSWIKATPDCLRGPGCIHKLGLIGEKTNANKLDRVPIPAKFDKYPWFQNTQCKKAKLGVPEGLVGRITIVKADGVTGDGTGFLLEDYRQFKQFAYLHSNLFVTAGHVIENMTSGYVEFGYSAPKCMIWCQYGLDRISTDHASDFCMPDDLPTPPRFKVKRILEVGSFFEPNVPDYALLELDGNPPKSQLTLFESIVYPQNEVFFPHHPDGLPQAVSYVNPATGKSCKIVGSPTERKTTQDNDCWSQGGSSGAPIMFLSVDPQKKNKVLGVLRSGDDDPYDCRTGSTPSATILDWGRDVDKGDAEQFSIKKVAHGDDVEFMVWAGCRSGLLLCRRMPKKKTVTLLDPAGGNVQILKAYMRPRTKDPVAAANFQPQYYRINMGPGTSQGPTAANSEDPEPCPCTVCCKPTSESEYLFEPFKLCVEQAVDDTDPPTEDEDYPKVDETFDECFETVPPSPPATPMPTSSGNHCQVKDGICRALVEFGSLALSDKCLTSLSWLVTEVCVVIGVETLIVGGVVCEVISETFVTALCKQINSGAIKELTRPVCDSLVGCPPKPQNNVVKFAGADKVHSYTTIRDMVLITDVSQNNDISESGTAIHGNAVELHYNGTSTTNNELTIKIVRDGSNSTAVQADILRSILRNAPGFTVAEEDAFADLMFGDQMTNGFFETVFGRSCNLDDKILSNKMTGINFGHQSDKMFQIGNISLVVPELMLMQAAYSWSAGFRGNIWWVYGPYCRRHELKEASLYCTTTNMSHMVLFDKHGGKTTRNEFAVSSVDCRHREKENCIANYCSWYYVDGNIDGGECRAPFACKGNETNEIRYWPGWSTHPDAIDFVFKNRTTQLAFQDTTTLDYTNSSCFRSDRNPW
mmetsp:Transcript_9308/g.17594  ORF Transcript_9308/g.17594 Transcript_9308/m.17594 type:complete len:920 (-) Transcript_9308:13-2772(-)